MKQGILIVDDHDLIREGIKRFLSDAGYLNVMEAPSGVQALSLMQEKGEEVYVLILDLVMPEMNGLELIQHLVNVHQFSVGVIMLTGYSSGFSKNQFFSLGNEFVHTREYFEKGGDVDRLLEEIRGTITKIEKKRSHRASEELLVLESQLNKVENYSRETLKSTQDVKSHLADLRTSHSLEMEKLGARLEKVEAQLGSMDLKLASKLGFVYGIGLDVLRAFIIGMFVLCFLYFGIGDVIESVVNN